MRVLRLLTLMTTVLILFGGASAQMCQDYLYSVDLGGDMDFSDPSGNGISNWMDCGAIYRVSASTTPVLWKDDDPLDGGFWGGVPFASAPQPTPPPGIVPESTVTAAYAAYFDLDGEDQVVLLPDQIIPRYQASVEEFAQAGIYVPGANNIRLSFENDNAVGWYTPGATPSIIDVPSLAKIDNDFETYTAGISCVAPYPTTASPECVEGQLGLVPYPPSAGQDHDDDVDALDWHEENLDVFVHRYFTADHEAHLGLDPGDIYYTKNDGTVNNCMVVDDMIHIGLPTDDVDVDAWEFVNISYDCAEQLFGPDFVAGLDPSLNILTAIFSVDQNDSNTLVDESGGLNPSVIYMTNLNGTYKQVSVDFSELLQDEEDIDALTVVPEPTTMTLLAVSGLALLRRKRNA
jgi:hypothetical protein